MSGQGDRLPRCGRLRGVALAAVHWLGLLTIFLLLRPEGGKSAYHPDLVTYDLQDYTSLSIDFFADEEAESIMRQAARGRVATPGFKPVMIFRDGTFDGMGTLIEEPPLPPYIATAKHLFINDWSAYYTYEILCPGEGGRRPIESVECSDSDGPDLAIARPGKATPIEVDVQLEDVMNAAKGGYHKYLRSELTSTLTGRPHQSLGLSWREAPAFLPRRVIFAEKIIGNGESGTGFVDEEQAPGHRRGSSGCGPRAFASSGRPLPPWG